MKFRWTEVVETMASLRQHPVSSVVYTVNLMNIRPQSGSLRVWPTTATVGSAVGACALGAALLLAVGLVPSSVLAEETPGESTASGEGEATPAADADADADAVEGEDAAYEAEVGSDLTIEELYDEGYQRFVDGDFAGARDRFEAVLARDPSHRFARNYLAECLAVLKGTGEGGGEDADEGGDVDEGRGEGADEGEAGSDAGGEADSDAAAETGSDAVGEAKAEGGENADAAAALLKRQHRNPRSDRHGGVGIGLFGPAIGVSVWGQWLPHWLVGVSGGAGGVVPTASSTNSGLGAFFAEVHLLPIPWRLTPVLGFGTSALIGSLVWQADAIGGVVAAADRFRLLVYGLVGARFDLRNGLVLSGGLVLLPSGSATVPLVPLPNLRAGLRF